jgi:hypothetical protein
MPREPRERDELRSNFWRRKLRPQILLRDNWMCHLCSQPINPSIKSPHPMSASVDHTHGAGTGFDPRFLKAAHLGCNVRRGDPLRTSTIDPIPAGRTRW